MIARNWNPEHRDLRTLRLRYVGLYRHLTAWSRVPLEKPTGLQPIYKFPAFYGTWRFITAFTSARHLSLSWASSIQSTFPLPTSWRSILIFSSHLRHGLPSGLFPSGFHTKILYKPLTSSIRSTCSDHLILQVSQSYKTKDKIIVLYILIFKFLGSKLEDKRFCAEWKQAFPHFIQTPHTFDLQSRSGK